MLVRLMAQRRCRQTAAAACHRRRIHGLSCRDSRTREDENTAVEHIRRLKAQARTLYQESGFKVKPVPVAAFKVADRDELNRLTFDVQLLVMQCA